jgi:hypothetical protein
VVYASHSELGLIRWERADPESPTRCLEEVTRAARTVRNVGLAGDRLLVSVDNRVISFAPADEDDRRVYEGSQAVITALLAAGDDLYAGNADGQILHWPADSTHTPRILHGGSRRPAESVALITTGGVSRLFYTDTTMAVFARVLGDTFTCHYEAGGQTLQRAEVAADLVAAIDDPRHRLLIWRPNASARPAATIHVARITEHSIQDVTLAPLERS